MKITDQKTIEEVQEEFNKMFEGLKLEFYKSAHSAEQGSPAKDQLDSKLTIGAARTQHNDGDFTITPDMSVAAFENALAKQYGLNVQVFRRSAELWLQTSKTDSWTLAVQNQKGIHSTQVA